MDGSCSKVYDALFCVDVWTAASREGEGQMGELDHGNKPYSFIHSGETGQDRAQRSSDAFLGAGGNSALRWLERWFLIARVGMTEQRADKA